MRLALLFSTLVIGASLLTSPNVVSAAKVKKHAVSTSRHSKAKRPLVPRKPKVSNPGDIWQRISSGLRLHLPLPEPTPSLGELSLPGSNIKESIDNKYAYLKNSTAQLHTSLTTSASALKTTRLVTPHTATAPEDNYTELGRKLLGKKATSASDCQPSPASYPSMQQRKLAKTRMRSQFHPELHKQQTLTAKPLLYRGLTANSQKTAPCVKNVNTQLAGLEKPSAATDTTANRALKHQELLLLATQQRIREEQRQAKALLNYERVKHYVDWYAQRRYFLYEVAERAQPYLYHIVEGLSKQHLPLDLALLPIVESAYQPTAQSPKSAAGIWQFIPSTGNDYNLNLTNHYDERLDITASTKAAINYLAFLNQHFSGDWLLALAAYNCGIGRVDEAIRQNSESGLPTDYWSLQLPEETQAYVPRILALSTLFADPAKYNLKLSPISNEPYFVTVKVEHKTDLNTLVNKEFKTIAQLADIKYEHFSHLNPGYLKTTLPTGKSLQFLMPIANANLFYQRLHMLTQFQQKAQQTTNPFSTVSSFLSKASANELPYFSSPYLSLAINTATELPHSAPIEKTPPIIEANSLSEQKQNPHLKVHYLEKGETLSKVARHFDVSIDAIRSINKLPRNQTVNLGQRLTIPPKKATTVMLEPKSTTG